MDRTYTFFQDITRKQTNWEIDLELSIEEYAAIGLISAQWAFLDFHITEFCTLIADAMGESLNEDFLSDSFRKRKRAWQALISRYMSDGSKERIAMEDIVRRVGEVQGERQIAIHAFFEWDRKNPKQILANSHKNPKARPRPISADKLNAVARKISAINADFLMFPASHPEIVGSSSLRGTLLKELVKD